jgi:hypothetical protein
MNFGWGQNNFNGWYTSNSYNPNYINHCYMKNQEMIKVRKP